MSVDKRLPILVVNDQKTMLRIIRSFLKQLGFENVTEAETGTAALTLLREKPFELVICDWSMQPMSGLELLKELQADAAFKDLPVLMVTAESDPDSLLAARQAGVSNYIVKPFNADTLQTKLQSVLDE